jgi:hypothetical protein
VWSDDVDAIIGGDLTATLAYATPAEGAVATPVAPIGLRDREAGTVAFTTSLGFGRKLDRIAANPRVALAYHAREHGFAARPSFVLVQGTATYDASPDSNVLEERVRPASERFMGPPKTGLFWDRWLSAYYADRVLVTVQVERVLEWAHEDCAGEPRAFGGTLDRRAPEQQSPPKGGTAPRIDAARAAARLRKLPHVLLAYLGTDGFPVIAPVDVGEVSPEGISLSGPLPSPQRRAGLLGHRYEAQLIGLEARQYTGWLGEDGLYAPHTESGFQAPANKTVLLLANGFMARRGLKKARAMGRA